MLQTNYMDGLEEVFMDWWTGLILRGGLITLDYNNILKRSLLCLEHILIVWITVED
jgi:hypothetical protein